MTLTVEETFRLVKLKYNDLKQLMSEAKKSKAALADLSTKIERDAVELAELVKYAEETYPYESATYMSPEKCN